MSAVPDLEVKRHLDPADIATVSAMLEVSASHDGHRPLNDAQWLDLVAGGRDGFAAILARTSAGDLIGYAQLTRLTETWLVEYVVEPTHRAGSSLSRDLVGRALEVVAADGGGSVQLWIPRPTPEQDEMAATLGLQPGRELLQMRRRLPVGERPTIQTRAFVPGRDDERWLEVNNRAFDGHPEQGHWNLASLKLRQAEPWFDAAGFLLHERGDRLAAFCWTKVHAHHDPSVGEIYVIAVDPDFAGQGLGRQLTLAGLDHLWTRGLTIAMLYVDRSNTAATHLYEELDFAIDHRDRAYAAVLPKPLAPSRTVLPEPDEAANTKGH